MSVFWKKYFLCTMFFEKIIFPQYWLHLSARWTLIIINPCFLERSKFWLYSTFFEEKPDEFYKKKYFSIFRNIVVFWNFYICTFFATICFWKLVLIQFNGEFLRFFIVFIFLYAYQTPGNLGLRKSTFFIIVIIADKLFYFL